MTNKGALRTSDIILSEGDKIVSVDSEILLNIVKSSSGKMPTNIADDLPPGTSFINIIEKL